MNPVHAASSMRAFSAPLRDSSAALKSFNHAPEMSTICSRSRRRLSRSDALMPSGRAAAAPPASRRLSVSRASCCHVSMRFRASSGFSASALVPLDPESAFWIEETWAFAVKGETSNAQRTANRGATRGMPWSGNVMRAGLSAGSRSSSGKRSANEPQWQQLGSSSVAGLAFTDPLSNRRGTVA